MKKDTDEYPDRRDALGKLRGEAYRASMPSPRVPLSHSFHIFTKLEMSLEYFNSKLKGEYYTY